VTIANEEKLAAYAREHDPAPITGELLVADGWEFVEAGSYEYPDSQACLTQCFAMQELAWFMEFRGIDLKITTMGHLRTALRLAKGE